MNPELLSYYQELVDFCHSARNCEYESFRVIAEYPEWGLTLSLKFIEKDGTENQLTPVPVEIFDIVQKIRDTGGPSLAWSEWAFNYKSDGKYNINVNYPDTPDAVVM
jgi:hypothetical protein